MLIVVAIGASALLNGGEDTDLAAWRLSLRKSMSEIAEAARDHRLIVVYGYDPRTAPDETGREIDEALRSVLPEGATVTVLRQTGIGDGGAETGAVIDKDVTAAILAEALNADRIVFLTDVDGIYRYWKSFAPEFVARARTTEIDIRDFARETMAPKVAAACRFARNTNRPAFIGNISQARRVVEGDAGTRIDR
ncbi:MAG TPA: hypothetical protein VF449_03600 [Parvibaculum sp.]